MRVDAVLMIGNQVIDGANELSLDSDIQMPADAFSLRLLSRDAINVKAGTPCRVMLNRGEASDVVLTGVIDRYRHRLDRSGRMIEISGRDVVGQLIDTSMTITSAQNVNLQTLVDRYVMSSYGDLIRRVEIDKDVSLKTRVAVEPQQTIYDALSSVASTTGQSLWASADGVLHIGNPLIAVSQPAIKPVLRWDYSDQDAISLEYTHSVDESYGQIVVYGQSDDRRSTIKGRANNAAIRASRVKIVVDPDVLNQHEADQVALKTMRDAALAAHALNIDVVGWLIPSTQTAWYIGLVIDVRSDIEPAATGSWIVIGRTLLLSRSGSATTTLRLAREQDWMQPIKRKQTPKRSKRGDKPALKNALKPNDKEDNR